MQLTLALIASRKHQNEVNTPTDLLSSKHLSHGLQITDRCAKGRKVLGDVLRASDHRIFWE